MKFIVTGGLGFIGSHMVERLLNSGHSVIVIDNLRGGKAENLANVQSQIDFFEIDVCDHSKLKNIAKDTDGIFHQAALTSVQESFVKKSDYDLVNVDGTENVLKIAHEIGIKVVFASSASVYGNPTTIPIREDSPRLPLNPYGESKLKAELLIEKYVKMGTDIVALRSFNVYGPRQNISYAGVITKFLENIKKQKPPIIYGNGTQVRDFVFVGDVVNANILAMTTKIDHYFINIGTGIATTINDLAKIILDCYNLSLVPMYVEPLPGDIQDSIANIELAKSILHWEPQMTLKKWVMDLANQGFH